MLYARFLVPCTNPPTGQKNGFTWYDREIRLGNPYIVRLRGNNFVPYQ